MSQYTDYFTNNVTVEHAMLFDQTFSLPPTTLTYAGSQSWTHTYVSTAVTAVDNDFVPGQKSWQFRLSSSSSTANRIRTNSTGVLSLVSDNSYSAGAWIKVDNFPTLDFSTTAPITFYAVRPASRGFAMAMYKESTTNKNTLFVTIGTTNYFFTDDVYPSIAPNTWNYVAIRRDGANAYIYLNGTLIYTDTNVTVNTTATMTGYDFGNTSTLGYNQYVNVASPYISGYNTIGATEITNIYNAKDNVNYLSTAKTASSNAVQPLISFDTESAATPITASSLMMHPTISATIGDNVYITTHFEASALSPSNVAVTNNANLNIQLTETLNASLTIGDNTSVVTNRNFSYSSSEFTASALMNNARVAEVPFIASATMGNHGAFVTPNYFSIIKNLNPYLYINNGQSTANIINYGTQSGIFTRGSVSDLLTNQTASAPLNTIAEGKCWYGTSYSTSAAYLSFETTNYANSFNNLIGTGNFAYEIWVNPTVFPPSGSTGLDTDNSYGIFRSEKIKLTLEDGVSSLYSSYRDSQGNWITGLNIDRHIELQIQNSASTIYTFRVLLDSTPLTLNNWNHVVINMYQSGINTNERLVQLWINGQIIINQNITFTTWIDNTNKNNIILGTNGTGIQWNSGMYMDECAIYSTPLTNSQILQHYNFITNFNPNFIHTASPLTANAQSGNHNFLISSSTNISASPMTSSTLFVMPSVLPTTTINYSSSPLIASALNMNVVIGYGRTMDASIMTVYCEILQPYFLNNIYYNYVQTNIMPYRYVSFDHTDPTTDFGSDNDYSVIPTVIGGTVVNPDLAINGKSAKTTGSSYVTDGVILKESEHDDNWGTGNNSWHSSFWIQRGLDDISTGLRVLWNLHAAYDNQYIVLYHYQNKLHLQINNQVGSPITVTSLNNITLFDYERHQIVINHHHNNNNNALTVYVDGVSIFTENIGSYEINTVNNPIHVGPNNEANNFARLSVGCLITPFASTALPVIPTNTRLIVDEIYWAKTQITSTTVVNVFNTMPDKDNVGILASPFESSGNSVMPTFVTTVDFITEPMIGFGQFFNPTISAQRFISNNADAMTTSILMTEPTTFTPVGIVADAMTASSTFNGPDLVLTVPGPSMVATLAVLKNPYINKNPLTEFNAYIRYVRSESYNNYYIPMMKEIK